jgi:hypothetical protein
MLVVLVVAAMVLVGCVLLCDGFVSISSLLGVLCSGNFCCTSSLLCVIFSLLVTYMSDKFLLSYILQNIEHSGVHPLV